MDFISYQTFKTNLNTLPDKSPVEIYIDRLQYILSI